MHLRRIDPPHAGLAVSQLLALQVIRRALGNADEGFLWRDAGAGLRRAHAAMLERQQAGIVVGREGAVLLTRHEKRLLRGTAAAQLPDPALLDNLIYPLAPSRRLRPFLTDAVARLAAALLDHGHHLPLALPIPC